MDLILILVVIFIILFLSNFISYWAGWNQGKKRELERIERAKQIEFEQNRDLPIPVPISIPPKEE